jgi:hypothetical protein
MPASVKGAIELRKALRTFTPDLAKETTKENLIEFQKNMIKDTTKEISKKALKEVSVLSKDEMLVVTMTVFLFVGVVGAVLIM